MKIILVCEAVFPENKGGLERWMQFLASEFVSLGHKVTYLNSAGVTEHRDGVEYLSITSKPWSYVKDGKRSIRQSLSFAFKVRLFLQKQTTDLLYVVQAPIFSVLALFCLPAKIKLTFVEWIEIWPIGYWRRYLGSFFGIVGFFLQGLALQVGDSKIVFTDRLMKQTSRYSFRNNVIRMPGLCPNVPPEKKSKFKHRNDLIFLSRFVAEKQPQVAIAIAKKLRGSGWEGSLNMIGTGPLANAIKDEIKQDKAETWINFLENASESEVAEAFNQSFLLLHPSKREGYGLSMVEAAIKGVPTLLINYPDNTSVDLQISPNLICESDLEELLYSKVQYAKNHQLELFEETQDWVYTKMTEMTGKKSVISISELAKSLLEERERVVK